MHTTQDPLPALAFDIGGSTTKVGLVSRSGCILRIEQTPTDVETVGLDSFLAKFTRMLRRQKEQADGGVAGIGGTFLGWIDENRTGPYLCMNAPALHGVDLLGFLRKNFHLPVHLIDDANAHALAEYSHGTGRGYRRFMDMALGTGVCAAVILDGKPLQFTGGCLGDAGHIILRPGGPECSAGCKGCGEALIGVAGIERLALEEYGAPRGAREVIDHARARDDPKAMNILRTIGGYAGELLASISHIFLPERISLSGGTANAGPVLLEAVQERFEYLVGDYHRLYASQSGGYYRGVDIVLGDLKQDTALVGAAAHLFTNL